MNCCCNCHRCHAYELKFRQDGKIKHTAILKEPKANCLVYCRLEDVKEKRNGGKGRMNLQIGIFVALLVLEFFAVRIDGELGRIIDLLNEIKNKEA